MINPDSLVRLLNLERDLTAPPEQREEIPDAEASTDQHDLVAGHPGSPRGRVGSRGQMAVDVLVLAAPVVADRWVYAWQLPASQGGLTVTCEHDHHLTAPVAVGCRDRLRVETEAEPWIPLGPRPR